MPTTVTSNSGNGNSKLSPSPPVPLGNKPSPSQSDCSPGNEVEQAATSSLSPVLAPSSPLPVPASTSPISNDVSTNGNGKTKKVWDCIIWLCMELADWSFGAIYISCVCFYSLLDAYFLHDFCMGWL